MTGLRLYVRHAERYGVAGILEAAAGELPVEQLATLAARPHVCRKPACRKRAYRARKATA